MTLGRKKDKITYNFDWRNYECESCEKEFHISGYICEYPVGAYNYGDIKKTLNSSRKQILLMEIIDE